MVLKRHRTHFPNASRDGREYYIRVTPVCVGGGRETDSGQKWDGCRRLKLRIIAVQKSAKIPASVVLSKKQQKSTESGGTAGRERPTVDSSFLISNF